MKKLTYQASFIILLFCIAVLSGCGKEDAKQMTEQQRATQSLSKGSPWTVLSVDSKPDGVDEQQLSDIQLSFGVSGSGNSIAPSTFTSSSSTGAFDSETGATWKWTGNDESSISISNGFVSDITDIHFNPSIDNPSSITLTFTMTKAINSGRVQGIGKYTITLK